MQDDQATVTATGGQAGDAAPKHPHSTGIDWKPILYWTCTLLVLFVLGPLAGTLVGNLRGTDGQPGVTPMTSTTMAFGVLRASGVLAIAALAGLLGSRLFHARDGMTFAGIVVAWAAYRTGNPDAILRHTQDSASLWRLSAEGIFFGLLGVALCVFVYSAHRQHPVEANSNRGRAERDGETRTGTIIAIGAAAAAAALAGGIVTWLIAVQSLKLQTIAAAACGAIAAGAAAQLVLSAMPGITPNPRRILTAGALAIAVLAGFGPVSALVVHGSSGLMRAVYAGNYFGLACPLALDWVAGALLGLPLGLSWSGSMIDKHQA